MFIYSTSLAKTELRYRSRVTILERILSIVRDNQPIPATRIMYMAFLSHSQTREYLDAAAQSLLVRVVKGERSPTYVLSPKGLDVLRKISELEGLIPEFLFQDAMEPEPSEEETMVQQFSR